jgi:hypothetical protein
MSVQDILHEHYLPAYPLLRHIHCPAPSTFLNIASQSHNPQQRQKQRQDQEQSSYSLLQHLFLELWVETCASHSVHATDTEHEHDLLLFHFHSHSIRVMTEDSVRDELVAMRESQSQLQNGVCCPCPCPPLMLFLLHQYHFYPSIQNLISSLSDFQLLFHSDTFHYLPPNPTLPAPASVPAPPSASVSAASEEKEKAAGDEEGGEEDDDDSNSSIPDFEEFVEKVISDFISNDGFDEENDRIQLQAGGQTQTQVEAEPSVSIQEEHSFSSPVSPQRSQSPVEASSSSAVAVALAMPVFHPPRKMRSLLSLISSLPKALHLSSSHSLDLQLYKLSEVLLASSIIAMHHLLKFDPLGKVFPSSPLSPLLSPFLSSSLSVLV